MADDVQITTRCLWCVELSDQCPACQARDTNNVVGIFDRQPVHATPEDAELAKLNAEVVEILEQLLASARDGEFTGIAAVLDGPNGLTTIASVGAQQDPIIYLGGLARVSHNIQMEVDLDES